MRLTTAQRFARALEQVHDIKSTMEDKGERELLQQQNAELYYAYLWLLQTAYPDDARWNP